MRNVASLASRTRVRLMAAGTACIVGIGYMDPGNWATDFDSVRFGETLLWSAIISGIAAVILQVLTVRLTVSTGEDLATTIARRMPKTAIGLWPLYLLAIIATDASEFVGLVIGLRLITPWSMPVVIGLAALAVFGVLAASGTALKRFERLSITTTIVVATTCLFLGFRSHVDVAATVHGALIPHIANGAALLAVIGIVGATIMPHNLFLHSGLVHKAVESADPLQRRVFERSAIRQTITALAIATAVNGAIIAIGAALHATTINDAYATLTHQYGWLFSSILALALIAAALSSSSNGVLAGDLLSVKAAPMRIPVLARRLFAVIPAAGIMLYGVGADTLLIWTQIALGFVLPTVVLPLLVFVAKDTLCRTRGGFALFASSSAVAAATLACDGMLINSMLPK